MDGIQAELTLAAAGRVSPKVEKRWRELYNLKKAPNTPANPTDDYPVRIGNTVRELAEKHGMTDRIPRFIQEGPQELNKLLAEKLFIKMRDLELEAANPQRIWAFREAAW